MKNKLALAWLMTAITFTSLLAQEKADHPQKTFEFGIGTEYNLNNVLVEDQSSNFSAAKNSGLGTSILVKYNISDRVSLLLESIIAFRDNNLILVDANGNPTAGGGVGTEVVNEIKGLNEVTIDVPLHVSYLPFSQIPLGPQILAGPRYRYNIINDENIQAHQFSFDVGVSVDFKFRNIIFRPALIYTRGLDNIVNSTSTITTPIRMDSYAFKLLFFG